MQGKPHIADAITRAWSRPLNAVLALLVLVAAVTTAAAAEKSGKVNAVPYLTVNYSNPVYKPADNQGILPNSHPTLLYTITASVTKATKDVDVKYDDTDSASTKINKALAAVRAGGESAPFPSRAGDSLNVYVNGDNFGATGFLWSENGTTITLDLDQTDALSADPGLVKKVSLYRSYSTFNPSGTFTYEMLAAGNIEYVGDFTKAGTQWSYDIPTLTSYPGALNGNSGTIHYFITVETANSDFQAQVQAPQMSMFGVTGYADSRPRFLFNMAPYINHADPTAAIATYNLHNSSGTLWTYEKALIGEVETIDMGAYPSWASEYGSSKMGLLMGIGLGPDNKGFPPASVADYANYPVKYTSVNGLDFYETSGNQTTDLTRILYDAPAEARRELVPLNEDYAVVGLNIAGTRGDEGSGSREYLRTIELKVIVPTGSSFNPITDLANDLQAAQNEKKPNVQVYRDVNNNGILDAGDVPLTLEYDMMGGEVAYTQWTAGSNEYTATLNIDLTDANAWLDTKADALPDFFVTFRMNPVSTRLNAQPKYGAEFTVQVTNVDCRYLLNDDGQGNPLIPAAELTNNTPLAANFTDITRNFKIALDVQRYTKDDQVDPLEADGLPVPVIGINMVDSSDANVNEKLHSIKVRFSGANFTPSKLAALTDDATSGVSLWKDNKAGNKLFVGSFDPRQGVGSTPFAIANADTNVRLATDSKTWYFHDGTADTDAIYDGTQTLSGADDYFFVILKPYTAIDLYDSDKFWSAMSTTPDGLGNSEHEPTLGDYRGMDYFVCIRGGGKGSDYSSDKRGLDLNDEFTVTVVPAEGDLLFGKGAQAVESGTIMAKAEQGVKGAMPTYFTSPSGQDTLLSTNEKTAVLGIDIVAPNDGNEYSFNHFAFQVIDPDKTFDFTDLVDSRATGDNCGIALYRDNGDGVFNAETDARISYDSGNPLPIISTVTWRQDEELHMIEMFLDPASVGVLPTDNSGANAGVDFFLVLQPTQNANAGDHFSIQLWGSDLLDTCDDTITYCYADGSDLPASSWPITYKRFQSENEFTVVTVTNDIFTDKVDSTVYHAPATPDEIAAGTDTAFDVISISTSDPSGLVKLTKLRLYFESDDALDPNWILNPMSGADSGIQLFQKSANKRIAFSTDGWVSQAGDESIAYYADGKKKAEAGDTLLKINASDKIAWHDTDNNGIWSAGDSLWYAAGSAVTQGVTKFDPAVDFALAGDPAEGAIGQIVATDTYGFAFVQEAAETDWASSWNGTDGSTIYFLGTGRTNVTYYIDLTLDTPAPLPATTEATEEFFVRARVQDDPRIFGLLRFRFTMLAEGILYQAGDSTSHSYASSNLTTESITFKSEPGVVSNLRVTRGANDMTVTWTKPEGDYANILVIRVESDDEITNTYVVDGYPVTRRYYSTDSASEYNTIDKFVLSGSDGEPNVAFVDYGDGHGYQVADPVEVGNATVVYIGKGEEFEDGTVGFVDKSIANGKFYYYMAYAGDVTNEGDYGTPNGTFPSNSRATLAAEKKYDQMIEAEPWGIKGVADLKRPEPVTGLTLEPGDGKFNLKWVAPTEYTNGETLDDSSLIKFIVLRREGGEIDAGLLQDGVGYAAGDTLGSDSTVIVVNSTLDGATVTFEDDNAGAGFTDTSKHYYYAVYAYYIGEPESTDQYNYSISPSTADAYPLNTGAITAYPTSISSLKGEYKYDEATSEGAITLTWSWGDMTTPKLLIARSTTMISGVYPAHGSVYAAGDTLADGVTVLTVYSGTGTTYKDVLDTETMAEAYYYAIYSYDSAAGIYNPTENLVLGTGTDDPKPAALASGVNMCGVSTKGSSTDVDLDGYIYNASGDQTLNDTDDDGITDYDELAGTPMTLPNDPYSPLKPRSLSLVPAYAYAQVTDFNPPRTDSQMLEFWFSVDTINPNTCNMIRVAQTAAGSVDEIKVQMVGGNQLTYSFLSTATNTLRTSTFTLPSGAFTKDAWYHVAVEVSNESATTTKVRWVVYDQEFGMAYEQEESVSGVRDLAAKSTNLIFGEADSAITDARLKFYLDEVRFWSVINDDDTIAAGRLLTVDPASYGLEAYYRFDDGGYTAEDYTKSFAGDYASLADIPTENLNAAAHRLGQNGGENGKALFSDNVVFVDTDADGIPDWWEYYWFGALDFAEPGDVDGYTDCDEDGLNDYYEYLCGTDPTDMTNGTADADADNDYDSLSNLEEQIFGTNPIDPDTDDDGDGDYDEIAALTNPLYSMSVTGATGRSLAPAVTGALDVPLTADERKQTANSWTVEAWVEADATAGADRAIISRSVWVKNRLNKLVPRTVFELGVSAARCPYVKYNVGTSAKKLEFNDALPTGWNHLAAVWNGSDKTLTLMVNGTALKSVEFTNEQVYFSETGLDAVMTMADGDWQAGDRIDEVRVWTQPRELSTIFDRKDVLVQGTTGGLYRAFRFDDGGATIEDFAHPGYRNAKKYAVKPAVGGWADDADAVPCYGMDDSNGNGMPDWFENFYAVTDAGGDEDEDGLTNLYEYLAGTDPTVDNGDYDAICPAGTMSNGRKQEFGLDPRLADSDGDGVSDYDEIEGNASSFKAADDAAYATDPLAPASKDNKDAKPKALTFSGTAVTAPASAKYAVESWTLMAMVKPTSGGVLIRRQVSETAVNYELGLDDTLKPYARFRPVGGAEVRVPENAASVDVLEADKWNHVAATFDAESGEFALYVNGMAVARRYVTGKVPPIYGNQAAYVAEVSFGDGFSGQMDQMAIFGSALDGESIYANVGATNPGDEAKVTAYGSHQRGFRSNFTAPEDLVVFPYKAGELIVKFQESVSEELIAAAEALTGARVLKRLELTGAYLVQLPENMNMVKAIKKIRTLNKAGELLYCEPNRVMPIYKAEPNDPGYSRQWGLEKIGAPEVWDTITDAGSVTVAVIDTGVDYTHPDLAANMWVNEAEKNGQPGVDDDGNGYIDDIYGYSSPNDSGDPMDVDGHGTHCAGIIGAVGDNGIGVAGVNWKVKIMAVRNGAEGGMLWNAFLDDCVEAFDYTVKMGVKITSNSWAWHESEFGYSDAIYDAIARARDAGQLVVCAAGNERTDNDQDPSYPASYDLDNIISVAATDQNDKLASFSCYGKTSVDVGAPGVQILSTIPGGYDAWDGTSMATPMVAGMAGLMLAQSNGTANWRQLKSAILNGADKVSSLDGKTVTGGRVNLAKSMSILNSFGAVAAFTAQASDGSWLYDLTEAEFGATAYELYGAAPAAGRTAVDLTAGATVADLTADEDILAFNGDSDGDNMPNWYEMVMGLQPLMADGTEDPDGDGLTNAYEYRAGTSPWTAMSDGSQRDAALVNAATGLTYLECQEKGYDPLMDDTTDQDDDTALDVEDANAAASTVPYVQRFMTVDGSEDGLVLPNLPKYSVNGDWSVDAWVRLPAGTSGDDYVLVERTVDTDLDGTADVTEYRVGFTYGAAGWMLYARQSGFESDAKLLEALVRNRKPQADNDLQAASTAPVKADEWTHVAAVKDAAGIKLFIDNKQVCEASAGEHVAADGFAGIVSHVVAANGFTGDVNVLRIWSAARENFDDYKEKIDSVPVQIDGLTALFLFDDSGETVEDFTVASDWLTGWKHAAVKSAAVSFTDVDDDGLPMPINQDTDNDGIDDWWEMEYFGDLTTADENTDYDKDGLSDLYEFRLYDLYRNGLIEKPYDPTDPYSQDETMTLNDAMMDPDGDLLVNGEEQEYGTNPGEPDTDGDGFDDYTEVYILDSDPLDYSDPWVNRYLDLVLPEHKVASYELEWNAGGTWPRMVLNPEGIDVYDRTADLPYAVIRDFNGQITDMQNYTIELWFKLDEGSSVDGALLQKCGATGPLAGDFALGLSNGHLAFQYLTGAGYPNWYAWDDETAPTFAAGEGWCHVAVVVSAGADTSYSIQMYAYKADTDESFASKGEAIKGKLSTKSFDGDLFIGAMPEDATRLSAGIDEIRIWNEARTAAQVKAQRSIFDPTDVGNFALYVDFDREGAKYYYSLATAEAAYRNAVSEYNSARTRYYNYKNGLGDNPSDEEKQTLAAYESTMNYWNRRVSETYEAYQAILAGEGLAVELRNEAITAIAMPEYGYESFYMDGDSDGDGISDWWEYEFFGDLDTADGAGDTDYDGDGLSDLYEFLLYSVKDENGNAVIGAAPNDPYSLDFDNRQTNDGDMDSDGDGLLNREEAEYGTDPTNIDTDDDGVNDKVEVAMGASPLHPMSVVVNKESGALYTGDWETIKANQTEYRAERAKQVSLDLGGLADAIELPDPDRFAVGALVVGSYDRTIGGAFTLEMWVKATEGTEDGILFETKSTDTQWGWNLRLENGSPKAEFINHGNSDEIVAYVGGTPAQRGDGTWEGTPALEPDTWTHVAVTWDPAAKKLELVRDGLAIIGALPVTYDIDFGTTAEYARINKVAGVAIDEFRFWNATRTDEQLEYWKSRIVPAPLESIISFILDENGDRNFMTMDKYPLKAYYRFDDGGETVEDFANFQDNDYRLSIDSAAFFDFDNGAKKIRGVDDVDGDGMPEWWVQYWKLNKYMNAQWNLHGRGFIDVPGYYGNGYSAWQRWLEWSSDGSSIKGLMGSQYGVSYGALGGYSSFYGSEADVSQGGVTTVGALEGPYWEDSQVLSYDMKYVRMHKYFMLDNLPAKATLQIVHDGASIDAVFINQQQVAAADYGDVAKYLQIGRNQIVIVWTRTIYHSVALKINDKDYTRNYYHGSVDANLNVDGQDVVVLGKKAAFDPRAVWYFEAVSQYEGDTYENFFTDASGNLIAYDVNATTLTPSAVNYAIALDPDSDGLQSYYEYILGTGPLLRDSDNNGIMDGDEDYDYDGITNAIEANDLGTDPLCKDTDNDGFADNRETGKSTDPTDWNDPFYSRTVSLSGELDEDGNSVNYVLLPAQSRFALADFTLEVLVRPADDADVANLNCTLVRRVVGTLDPAKPMLNYELGLKNGRPYLRFTDKDGNYDRSEVIAPNAIASGEWTHLAASYAQLPKTVTVDPETGAETTSYGAANTMSIYLNGVLVRSTVASSVPCTTGPALVYTRLGEGFKGQLDEVRFWSVARTAEQINAAMDGVLGGDEDGLVAYYRFDDFNLAGRQSVAGVGVNPDDIEYYLYAADSYVGSLMDWKTEWANAAIVVGGDLSSSGSFVSEITGLEIDVEAYSGGTELVPKVAYVDPADSANDDVVKAVIVTEAYEADGGDINYLYFWLKTDEDGMADDGLTCNGTDLLDQYDKVLESDVVIGRATEIDLSETDLVPGDHLQLVIVPVSTLGTVGQPEFSAVITIAEPAGEEGLPGELVLTAINGKTDIKDQTGIAAGKALSVKVYNPNAAGKAHIQWFCNYLPVESSEVAIGKEASATLKLKNTSKVKEGDVWTFKVWYVSEDGKARSKSVPSVGENSQPYYAEWIYLMIGSPYDAQQQAGSTGTTKTLTPPVSVEITPTHIVEGSTIIANAKGGNGDGYAYQWYYRSGSSDASAWVAAGGQTLPYWQKATGSVTVDDSYLTVTGFDDDYNGDYYNLRNYGLNLWVLYGDITNRYSTKQSTWTAVLGYNTTLKAWVITRADDKLPSAVTVLVNALAYCVTANATPYTSDGKSLTWTAGTAENPPSAVPQTASTSNMGMTPAGFSSYVLAPNDALYCQVWSVDTKGNKSAQAATSNIAFVSNDTATGDGIFYNYEPDDRWQDAYLIAPKGNWFSLVDSAIQRHIIGDSEDLGAYDHDWVYFVVPDDGKSAKKLVSFETNGGTMFQRGVKPATSNYPNTALTVYRLEGNKIREQFTVSRFSANDNTGDGTEMARFFQREMTPGIYYVDVWSESEGVRDMGAAYYMHLLIEDQVGVDEPYWSAGSGSLSAELTPYLPSADEDLQVTLNCKAYSSSGKELKRFFYLWYCNGAIVPFNGKRDVTEYTAGTYLYSCAVEGKDTVPSEQTQDGDVWMCQVYAYDPDYGFTDPITSNAVIIGGSVNFTMSFTPNKVYNYGTPAVEYGEEVVTIGWTPEATFGFDLGLDEAAPSRTIPNGDGTYTRVPLERGCTYTLGLSNNAPYLLTDIRPYNEISSWFVVVEMGLPNNDDIAACSLAWNANSLPVDGTGVLNITQMNKRADGFFEPVAGTTVTVSAADADASGTYSGVITLTEAQMAALQTDENGQKFAVFRVTVGTPTDMQTISLKKGWNLVALSVAPVNANVSDVFSDGGVRFYNGSVWQYQDGKYVEATTLEAGRGYWLYSRVDRDGINIMGAAADTAISLRQGWNIFGPIYKIDDFVATYKTAYPQIYDAIEKVPGTADQLELYKFDVTTGGYTLATDSSGKYVLTPGVGYWIKVKEAIQLPVVNK